MAQHVHYEIFRRKGAASWGLVEARENREDALKFAEELCTSPNVGIKVVKETYNEETGDYLSLKIFEHGENKKTKASKIHDDVPTSPCFKPDDLYSYHARKTIASLIPDYLARHKVTVTELGHRADLLEKLEATGTLLQHAVQRVAVAQAADGGEALPKIIRGLHDLTTQVIHRVYRDTEKARFPVAKAGEFAALAAKLARDGDGRYLLNGALAQYLKDAKGWDEKVARLMTLMAEAGDDSDGGKLLLAAIDSVISEVLTGSAGLRELIGAKENHGAAVMGLVRLFLGKEPDGSEACQGLVGLTRQFAADTLPSARTAIARRIVSELRSFKRLCPDSLEQEFKTLRQIANLVVMGIGKYLSHEDLVASFVLRSQRLITAEALSPYLTGITPDAKLERLLFVEENIIGAENKRRLADFIPPIITSAAFEEYYQSPRAPLIARLQQLESLRIKIFRSNFQENQRAEFADTLDRVATAVENRNRLFDMLEKKPGTPSEKAAILLKLMNAGTFTEPRLSGRARQMIIAYLSKPGFLTDYVAQASQPGEEVDRDAIVADLMGLLQKAGITPETGLKTIAA